MSTVNIRLPDALQAFVDERVAEGGYRSPGEYLRELVRKDQDRQALRGVLLDGAGSAPGRVADDAWFDGLRQRLDRPAAE